MKTVNHAENEPEIISRITDLLIQRGISQTELLTYLGLNRNVFTDWKARRNKSYLMYIDEIAKYFDVSPTYLLRGEEDHETSKLTKLTKREQELLQLYRCISTDSKAKLVMTARALANLERKSIK